MSAPHRLFTPGFFVMCGFSFTVFLSVFQLLPTAPFHIHDLGGSTFASGLFLGFLTYSSAFSAPLTGAVVDRVGQRRVLITSSIAITVFSILYGWISDYRWLLALVVIHGIFWSGLLSASAAYMTNMLPAARRAEGIGYWGLSSVLALAVAPTVGFWIYRQGWWWLCAESAILNIVMAVIASRLQEIPLPAHRAVASLVEACSSGACSSCRSRCSCTRSATAESPASPPCMLTPISVRPKAIYLTTLAVVVLLTRPIAGRLGDRFGYRKIFLPCLVLISVGLACLAVGGTRPLLIASALIFGVGFGTAYPVYVGYVMRDVSAARRGAAFGAILAAFDTGIGTGSTSIGWMIQHYGFRSAFGAAAILSALAVPYFLVIDRRLKAIAQSGVA